MKTSPLNLLGLSNSGQNYKNPTLVVKQDRFSLSIDMLSFTAYLNPADQTSLDRAIRFNRHVSLLNTPRSSLLEGQAYDNALYFKLDGLKPFPTGNNFRVELNPNRMTLETYADYCDTFLTLINNASVTRLDIAFDTQLRLADYYCHVHRIADQNIHLSGAGSKQTHYFGTRNSARFIRIYDKIQQLVDTKSKLVQTEALPDSLWRFELQLKKHWLEDWEVSLDGVTMKIPNYLTLPSKDYFYVRGLIEDPITSWDKLQKDEPRKVNYYRKLIASMETVEDTDLIPEMKSLLELAKSDIARLINIYTVPE